MVILGTNEIASAVAVRLRRERYRVLMCHDPFPPVIRRGMAFYDVLFDDQVEVEGMPGRLANTTLEIGEALARGVGVAVTPLRLSDVIPLRVPDILVDARIQKHRVTPDLRKTAGLSIGLAQFLRRLQLRRRHRDTSCPYWRAHRQWRDAVGGRRAALPGRRGTRTLRLCGAFRRMATPLDIGARVFKGFIMGRLDGLPVPAPMDGRLRGIARDTVFVPEGVKFIEIDPRGTSANWTGSDERGRTIAEATAAAIAASFSPAARKAPVTATLH